MKKKYSLVIHPSETILALIKSMKEELFTKIKWFASKNSVGHITICNFEATEKELENIKNQIKKICNTLPPAAIHLDEFGSYPNGAFFIAPDSNSQKNLKQIMAQFNNSLRLPNMVKSSDPHLSIARQLTPEKLSIAKEIFTAIDLNFDCCNVVLREFDPKIQQYFVIDTFEFGGNTPTEMIQGTLF